MGQGNDIFIFDMGKPVKITDMACRMIKLAGLQPDKDIEIVYTGLRPGEKLYEELLYNEENSTPTLNPKIFKGISLKQDYDKIKPHWLRSPSVPPIKAPSAVEHVHGNQKPSPVPT